MIPYELPVYGLFKKLNDFFNRISQFAFGHGFRIGGASFIKGVNDINKFFIGDFLFLQNYAVAHTFKGTGIQYLSPRLARADSGIRRFGFFQCTQFHRWHWHRLLI